jgi:hypothetical protein
MVIEGDRTVMSIVSKLIALFIIMIIGFCTTAFGEYNDYISLEVAGIFIMIGSVLTTLILILIL